MSMNKVIILGRLGQDPELKYTQNGTAICNLSMATSESWNDKETGQKQERTEWHRVVVFGKLAELCNQYLSKGKQALVEGKNQTRSWEDKDGNKRYTTEIVSSHVQFIGGGIAQNSETSKGGESSPNYKPETSNNFANDDIPF